MGKLVKFTEYSRGDDGFTERGKGRKRESCVRCSGRSCPGGSCGVEGAETDSRGVATYVTAGAGKNFTGAINGGTLPD